jgi:outer membrane protein OmpA-like peptidoglycan-associated protein
VLVGEFRNPVLSKKLMRFSTIQGQRLHLYPAGRNLFLPTKSLPISTECSLASSNQATRSMNNDVVETARHYFTDQVINQLSVLVGETKWGVKKALGQAVQPVLSGFLHQAEQGTSPETLLHLVRDADAAEVLTHLASASSFVPNGRGPDLLLDLLGDAYGHTVHRIAEEANIQPAASSTLLQTAATAVLGVLGKFAVENYLTPSEFAHWLHSQQEATGAATPPLSAPRSFQGLSQPLATARPGATQPPALGPSRHLPSRMAGPYPENEMALAATPGTASAERWQLGGMLLLALSFGYFLGREQLNHSMLLGARPAAASPPATALPTPLTPAPAAIAPVAPVAVAPAVPEAPPVAAPPAEASQAADLPAASPPVLAAPDTQPRDEPRRPAARVASVASAGRYDPVRDVYIHDTGRLTVLTLPNGGGTENVGATSTEARLQGILTAFTKQADSVSRASAWVDFDHVYFEPGQTTLTPESMQQLTNVARILKTFPDVVVKIGAYTDSTGVGPEDLRFSEARARSVMTVLANQGVRLYRMFAQGYGAKYALVPNTTPANRALNRRVSIRVLRKHS